MTKYAVVIERSETGYGAYVPDLPGCIAVSLNRDELEKLIAEAIALHLRSLQEHGDPVPRPSAEINISSLLRLPSDSALHSTQPGGGAGGRSI